MPDDILISELSNAPQIDDSAVFPFSQDNGGTLATFKSSMSDIAGKVAEGTTYTNLQTTSKNLVGAINELAQGGGGVGHIITTASGTVAAFADGGNDIPYNEIVATIPADANGFSSITIEAHGNNILNLNNLTANARIYASNGNIATSSSYTQYVTDYLPVKGGESYYFFNTDNIESSTWGNCWYDKNKNYISGFYCNAENRNKAHTAPNNAYYLRLTLVPSLNGAVNYPSTVTTYSPFVGESKTISLGETLTQGGSLNVTTGLLTRTDTTTAQLTATQIKSVSGANIIFHDAGTGEIAVEYFNEDADEFDELIKAETRNDNYSYDERIVGTWLDGSVLYEKTLFFNNKALQKNDNDSELKHGVTNIGSVKFVAEAYCDFEGGQVWKPCQNMIWDNANNFFQMVVGSTAIYLLSASGVYFSANVNRSYLIKIRYTKS